MEFDFNINSLFNETISLVAGNTNLPHRHDGREKLKELEHVIQTIGIKSAHAQNLTTPITSWIKLRVNNHRIYLLKDPSGNNGLGTVIGFMKIGKKQLFILDREGNHNEIHPLCVLDFYVHESQQRKGLGLKLFKHMLQAENVEPSHLAIDRPSLKFTSFLRKHFNLWATLPQVNNFVVFDGFFKNRKDVKRNNGSRRGNHFQDENDCRPLSRTASEDVIKLNRQKRYEDILKGIRPSSGSRIGSGDQMNYSRYQDSGQTARANMFSRFTADENNSLPPLAPGRRRGSQINEEIITNPYRRTTNIYSRSANSEDRTRMNNGHEKNDALLAVNDRNPGPKSDLGKDVSSATDNMKSLSSLKPSAGKQLAAEKPDAHTNEKDSEKANFVGHKNPFATTLFKSDNTRRYRKPSDMILELQQRDRENIHSNKKLLNLNHNNHPNSRWYSSSWNVMGVPSQPAWRNYKPT